MIHHQKKNRHQKKNKKEEKNTKKRALEDTGSEAEEKPKKKINTTEYTRDELTAFVGGLPWSYTEENLREDYKECGEIESIRIPLNEEGKSKGIAFITFITKEGLDACMKYDGTDCGGRTLRINPAGGGPKGGNAKGGKKGKGKGKGPGEKPEGCKSVRVYGLGADTWDDAVRAHFEKCGEIERVKVPYDDNEASRLFAFVDFVDESSVEAAGKLHDSELDGMKIRVEYSMPREKGDKGKGKGKGKDGKGKGKGKKGKGGLSAEKSAAKNGSMGTFEGKVQTFGGDSDSD